jgi:hypothetical protein
MQADSVAVNQPKILPPMMMKGVISAGTEMNSARASSPHVALG